MMRWYADGYSVWWIFMILRMVIGTALVIGGVIFLLRLIKRENPIGYRNYNRALEILDEKFASGEISEEEYLRKKKILKDS
ncbi:SHOCT domain-containing protein [Fonticella tunisiensis]|uniref:Putative membrane protein n=1 Tax=Fonticella tunisiensis TaxID=1096341 RepID=A0A4R7KP26_9CLOT|nr:SHOCT domain-containing protein [Fonticella tunisiensis]TDT58460.1 putative membrane protein [Fonticella tunisiensis]